MKKAVYIFSMVFVAKLIINLFVIKYPFFSTLDTCTIMKASKNIFENCSNLIKISNSPETTFLYPALMNPLFLLTNKITAFKIGIAINTLIGASILIPLYHLFGHFLKNKNHSIFLAILVYLIPTVASYELSLTHHILLIASTVWTIYFYLVKQKIRFYLPAAIITAISSPLGIIMLLAIIVNKLICNRNKKQLAIFLGPVLILGALFISVFLLENPNFKANLVFLSQNISIYELFYNLLKIVNTLILTTFLLPLIAIILLLSEKSPAYFKKAKLFITIVLLLNIFWSTIWMSANEGISNAAININSQIQIISTLVIVLFGLIHISNLKSSKYSVSKILILSVLAMFSVFFVSIRKALLILGLDTNQYYDYPFFPEQIIGTLNIPMLLLISILILGSIIGIFLHRKQYCYFGLLLTVLISTGINMMNIHNFSRQETRTVNYLKDKPGNILFIARNEQDITYDYIQLLNRSKNNVNLIYINNTQLRQKIDQNLLEELKDINIKRIITPLLLDRFVETKIEENYIYTLDSA